MGYICEKYLMCDGCGRYIKNLFKNKKFGQSMYKMWAETNGWEISREGWYCPKCRRIRENEKSE